MHRDAYDQTAKQSGGTAVRKTLLSSVSLLASAAMLAALLLGLSRLRAQAAPPASSAGQPAALQLRSTFTPELTIVYPAPNAVLNATQLPSYPAQIEYDSGTHVITGSALLEAVSVTVDGGLFYHEAISGLVAGRYVYNWPLPLQDNVSHTLIARGRDGWGDVHHSQALTVHVDTVAPTITLYSPPVHRGMAPIPLAWQASDGSGIARAQLYYRGPGDTEWLDAGLVEQSGFGSTFYFSPGGYLSYTFAAQATDNAGNASLLPAEGLQVIVEQAYVYLPLTLCNWAEWYRYEPNDTPDQAFGPLIPGQLYEAYMWDATDQNDYYHITPNNTDPVNVALTHIPAGRDYDLYIYYHDGNQYQLVTRSAFTGDVDEQVTFTPVAGQKYYIRVYRFSALGSQQPYNLQADYSAGSINIATPGK